MAEPLHAAPVHPEPGRAAPLYYVDRSDIREGRLEDVRNGMRDLAEFVEAREPQLIAYQFYIDETESTMTLVAVHPDSASLEFHMELGGEKFRAFAAFIRMRSIDVYGRPSPAAVDQLRRKAEMLGGGTVTVHTRQAGFTRP
ncbi:hypothetical protein M8Z33_22025 [Streptomyces sp. ZAF1911]|uniref:hypothetical protein n=1 Tax=unclassified Streptomyces TaxID=2593676 RepID=UPI002030C4F4|nr:MULTISPECIES: hypothetical protein [unclassified Streptomyces]MCM1975853.1 hypothetical protein [Streptomyces sp. G1]MCX5127116.1 hypothetical protein [Streptomyces sp. NBC_00347]MCX5295450.1 hypothetical protein [Streptomyces sp. NBC_00193]MDD9379280.1 hypothetical protein [Streptomyces sp. ZAF1911]